MGENWEAAKHGGPFIAQGRQGKEKQTTEANWGRKNGKETLILSRKTQLHNQHRLKNKTVIQLLRHCATYRYTYFSSFSLNRFFNSFLIQITHQNKLPLSTGTDKLGRTSLMEKCKHTERNAYIKQPFNCHFSSPLNLSSIKSKMHEIVHNTIPTRKTFPSVRDSNQRHWLVASSATIGAMKLVSVE